jgi:hypothetical protein
VHFPDVAVPLPPLVAVVALPPLPAGSTDRVADDNERGAAGDNDDDESGSLLLYISPSGPKWAYSMSPELSSSDTVEIDPAALP